MSAMLTPKWKQIGSNRIGFYCPGCDDIHMIDTDRWAFTFKNDKENKSQVGVMAQYLQKVYPSAVVKGKDGYLRIRWDEMFYSMINAIKTLDKKLVAIASSISEMESDVLQIKSEQKNIKKQIAVLNSRAAKLERK